MSDPSKPLADAPIDLPAIIAATSAADAAALAATAATIETRAREYAERARSDNTRRAYEADWRHFAAWCERFGAPALPADPRLVARYLSAFAGDLKVSTLQRRLAAIQFVHLAAGHDFDARERTLREVWRGIRRTHGVAARGKAPLVTEELRAMLATLDPSRLLGVRDRALLLLGFAGCFRRSELAGLDVEHVAKHRDGLVVSLGRTKTDQEGAGAEKGIPYGAHPATCPVRALEDWLAASGVTAGPLFRAVSRHGHVAATRLSDRAVALVVKRTVLAAKASAIAAGNQVLADSLDPARYAGHSLRAGFITSAAAAGVSTHDIMRHSLHKREDTLRKYVRHATVFRMNAASKVGL